MTDQIELDRTPWPLAADLIEERGWTTGAEVDEKGRVCMEGAVRLCAPVPGDGPIYREVVAHRGRGASFKDAPGTTKDDVLHWLRIEAEPITDDELLEVFGPQWREVLAVVRRIAGATEAERQEYRRICWDLWRTPSSGYQDAYWAVLVGGGPGCAARRAVGAFVDGGYGAGVAAALARRHEIGLAGGIRQEEYDLLTAPWVAWSGTPAHPDDAVAVPA